MKTEEVIIMIKLKVETNIEDLDTLGEEIERNIRFNGGPKPKIKIQSHNLVALGIMPSKNPKELIN